jgi:hypothetical protein
MLKGIAAHGPRARDVLGLQAGDCGRNDGYAGAGDKPSLNPLLGVSTNSRLLLPPCFPTKTGKIGGI